MESIEVNLELKQKKKHFILKRRPKSSKETKQLLPAETQHLKKDYTELLKYHINSQ